MKEFDPTFKRIDSLVNIEMNISRNAHQRAFVILLQDIQDWDPSIDADDVIDYLEIKMRTCSLVEQQRKEI
jgi:hypothetical protein